METIILSVPDKLKEKMEHFNWVDWPKMAVKSLSEKVEDIEELEIEKRIAEISEILPDDKREVKESVVREVVESIDKTAEYLKSGKIKPMTLDEFNKWCDEL